MSIFPVVLDACVIYPSLLRDTLFRVAEAGLYQLRLSHEILDEVARNYKKRKNLPNEKINWLVSEISRAFPDFADPPSDLIQAMTNQEKDRHIVATAIIAKAQVIVTQNIKDFPQSALEPYGIEAQTPDTFLVHLYNLSPEEMVDLIRYQAADKKNPPRSVTEILNHLSNHAPEFCKLCAIGISEIEE
jgi:predicted nucleic acid-binding protein